MYRWAIFFVGYADSQPSAKAKHEHLRFSSIHDSPWLIGKSGQAFHESEGVSMVIKRSLKSIYNYPEGTFLLRKLQESVRVEARNIQASSAPALSYEAARELSCQRLGFGHQRLFKQILTRIEGRNGAIARCPNRIRCAHQEKILDGHEYYALRVWIGLINDSEVASLEEFGVWMERYSTLMSTFVRYADERRDVEVRHIDSVIPERFIESADERPGSVYIINRLDDLIDYQSWGGYALVEAGVFRESGLFLQIQGEFKFKPKPV